MVVTVTVTDEMMGWWLRVAVVVDRGGLASGGTVTGVTTVVNGGQTMK